MSLDNLNPINNYKELIQNQSASILVNNPLIEKDVWNIVDDLGLKVPLHRNVLTIKFSDFSFPWLKLLVKIYTLLRRSQGVAPETLQKDIYNLNKFDIFLQGESIYDSSQIDERTFESFDYYLCNQGYKLATINRYYASIFKFFEICRLEGWLSVETYWFKGKSKRTYPKNDEINYIPESVWNQLDQNLYHLPEPLQRMVLIIRTTGIRIGELSNLPLDCLRKRNKQWRLRLTTEKYNIDDELPIPPELAAIIKEQQSYIKQNFGKSYDYLFCNTKAGGWKTLNKKDDGKVIDSMIFEPQPKVMHVQVFNRWLNRLAKKCKIIDKSGETWHFSSHQFRRTLATVLTNAGIRDLIIQKYLRHRSLEMQRYYKHLLEKVLGSELEQLMKEQKYVDITGQLVTSNKPQNAVTELIRLKMYQITTQYGECHRPLIKAPCQTVNACWRCQHWRVSTGDLPYLQSDLKRVDKELEIAKKIGMFRQQQGLEDDRKNLLNCIQSLEQADD